MFHAFSFGELVNYHFIHEFAAEIKIKEKKEKKKDSVIKHSVLQILHNISSSYFHCTARRVKTQACPLTLHEELCSLVTAVSRS